jgi:hypothetical protein
MQPVLRDLRFRHRHKRQPGAGTRRIVQPRTVFRAVIVWIEMPGPFPSGRERRGGGSSS